ncbi:MAG: hypothetical protein QOG90_765 [Actinomycetota bacterium]|jgi:hypothetical protein
MSDWNTPSEPEKDAPLGDEPPASSVPLRFDEGGAASDSMPLPSPAASGESTSATTEESAIPVRYHDEPEEPAVTEPPTPEPTSWLHPDPVEPVGLETPPAEDEPPTLAGNAEHTPADVLTPPEEPQAPENPFEETVFDLSDLPSESRDGFSRRLTDAGISHRLEDDRQLRVPVENSGTVETWLEDWRLRSDEEIDVPESEDVEEVIAEADDEDDEIVFDLATLSTEERRHLSMRLTGAGVSHIWEVATDLVVSVEDAPAIERYVQEVRNPDGFGDEEMASFEEDSDVDDEEVYAAMSNLYVAADKLMQRPGDEATAGEFYIAVDDIDGLPAPFGFDPRVWAQVQELANKIADTLDAEGDVDTVGNDSRTLRQVLANYV